MQTTRTRLPLLAGVVLLCAGTVSAQCTGGVCAAVKAELERRHFAKSGVAAAFAPLAEMTADERQKLEPSTRDLLALHEPVVTVRSGVVSVTVGAGSDADNAAPGRAPFPLVHPMSGTGTATPMDPFANHFVEGIYVVDESDNIVASSGLMFPASHPTPTLTFALPAANPAGNETATLTAYASCSQHGLYKGRTVPLPAGGTAPVVTADSCAPASCAPAPRLGDVVFAEYRRQWMSGADEGANKIYAVSSSAAFIAKHSPYVTFDKRDAAQGSVITVTVGNAQNPHASNKDDEPNSVHWIDAIFVVNQADAVVAYTLLEPGDRPSTTFTFTVAAGSADTIRAYAHCNRHGLFKGGAAYTKNVDYFEAPTQTPASLQCYAACAGNTLPTENKGAFPVLGAKETTAKGAKFLSLASAVRHVEGVVFTPSGTPTDPVTVSVGSGAKCDGTEDEASWTACFTGAPTAVAGGGGAVFANCEAYGSCVKVTPAPKGEVTVRGPVGFSLNNKNNKCTTSALAADATLRQIAEQGGFVQAAQAGNAGYDKHEPVLLVQGDGQALITLGPRDAAVYPARAAVTTAAGDSSERFPWYTSSRHPMSDAHYIDLIYAVDDMNNVIAIGALHPSQEAPAVLSFTVPQGVTTVTPFAHCNIHGLFMGKTVAVNTATSRRLKSDVMSSGCGFDRCGLEAPGAAPLCAADAPAKNPAIALADDAERRAQASSAGASGGNGTQALETMHTPVVSVVGNRVTVTMPNHPFITGLSESRDPYAVHFITLLWVEDADDTRIAAAVPVPGQAPVLTFDLPSNVVSPIQAKAHCSQHGVSSSDDVVVTPGPAALDLATTLKQCLDVTTFSAGTFNSGKAEKATPCALIETEVLRLKDTATAASVKHTPYVTLDAAAKKATITVGTAQDPHPMVASAESGEVHYIDTLWLKAVAGGRSQVVRVWAPSPTEKAIPVTYSVAYADLPGWATKLVAYSHCNVHGLYTSESPLLTDAAAGWTADAARDVPCSVASCLETDNAADAQLVCDSLKAELERRPAPSPAVVVPGGALSSQVTLTEATTGGDTKATVVLVQKRAGGEVSTFANTPDVYVQAIVVEDQDNRVVAAGLYSPSEAYSTLEFVVGTGVTTLTPSVYVNTAGLIDGATVVFDKQAAQNVTCAVDKCLLTSCTAPADAGFPNLLVAAAVTTPNPAVQTTPAPVVAKTDAPATGRGAGNGDDDSSSSTLIISIIVIAGALVVLVGGALFWKSRQPAATKLSFQDQCELLDQCEDPAVAV